MKGAVAREGDRRRLGDCDVDHTLPLQRAAHQRQAAERRQGLPTEAALVLLLLASPRLAAGGWRRSSTCGWRG